MNERALPAVLALTLLVGCEESNVTPGAQQVSDVRSGQSPWFEERAAAAGIDFAHTAGRVEGRYLFPETVCGGAALVDVDGDGWLDVYLVQSGELLQPSDRPTNRLYRNNGDGTFIDVTAGSGADDTGYGIGVTAGDYDNDGDIDLYVTNVGANALLNNDGAGVFTNVTERAGVAEPGWSSASAFLDYDRDGDLDLFVANYMYWTTDGERECASPSGAHDYCTPKSYNAPARDALYRNNGDGTFTDVSQQAGLHSAFGPGLGVVCADFNNDGWIDMFVANDGRVDQLWINQHDGTFEDEALLAGCALDLSGIAKAGMGVDATDADDDGDFDLIVMNFHNETDSFYRRDDSHFEDVTPAVGLGVISRSFTRFGVGLVDFDNDGVLDLFEACGRVNRQEQLFSDDPYAEPNLLFRGTTSGRFEEVLPRGGANVTAGVSRAAVFGDIDNDGGVDVLVVNRDGPPHLLRNAIANRGAWASLRIINAHGSDAIGARVTCTVGERTITRTVRTAYSYCAANDPRIHLGLGEAQRIDHVVVNWPDGTSESFGPIDVRTFVTLQQGHGNAKK